MLLLADFVKILLIGGGSIAAMGLLCFGIGFLGAVVQKRKLNQNSSDGDNFEKYATETNEDQ